VVTPLEGVGEVEGGIESLSSALSFEWDWRANCRIIIK
jgi:hypothetical protein